jgi:multiple sugar transport system ATP-binding protein
MADLIAVMREGQLQQLASPEEIYDRPANKFVATFVGSPPMNLLQAKIDASGLQVAGITLPLEEKRRAACLAAEVTGLGIRPEDLSLVEPGTPGAFIGEVYVVEPMGNETLVDLRVGDERLAIRAKRGFTAPIGSKIGAAFDPANACFFDASGSTRVHRAPNKGGER